MPLENALTTLDAVKDYLEIVLTDTTQDEFLIGKINGISADIIDYVRFDLATEYVLPAVPQQKYRGPCHTILNHPVLSWL